MEHAPGHDDGIHAPVEKPWVARDDGLASIPLHHVSAQCRGQVVAPCVAVALGLGGLRSLSVFLGLVQRGMHCCLGWAVSLTGGGQMKGLARAQGKGKPSRAPGIARTFLASGLLDGVRNALGPLGLGVKVAPVDIDAQATIAGGLKEESIP